MPDKNWQFELEEYIKQGEPDKAEKSEAWQTAIGLQAVDGLNTSDYLLDTAKEHIEGKITIDEAQKRIHNYYEQRSVRTEMENETKEAETFGQERRRSFAEEKTEEAKGTELRTAEESTQERKTIAPIFTAEIFREKTERREAEERRKTIFMQEAPFAEQEKRKTIPIVAETGLAEKAAAAEEAEDVPQEAPKKEREQAKGAEIDIERLMREMTKRLWEEREAT